MAMHVTTPKNKTKHHRIVTSLRQPILDGIWSPGHQLENRLALESQFNVSSVTMQRALDQLSEEGFIKAFGRRGTFVAQYPPHLHRYALAFERSRPMVAKNLFEDAIAREAARLTNAAGSLRVEIYHQIQGHKDVADYNRLVDDVACGRLAGLVFVTFPASLESMKERLFSFPKFPIACLNQAPEGIDQVVADHVGFVRMALERFQALGRSRVAMIGPGIYEPFHSSILKLAADFGLGTKPAWIQGPDHRFPLATTHLMKLLFDPRQPVIPDALLITDDHLVQPALAGLTSLQMRPGKDLSIVAHSSFSGLDPALPGVERLGTSAAELLSMALKVLRARRNPAVGARTHLVPARFQDQNHLSHLPKNFQETP